MIDSHMIVDQHVVYYAYQKKQVTIISNQLQQLS